MTLIVGDFNSYVTEEGKFSTANKAISFQASRFAHVYEAHFQNYVDIGGSYFTHRSTTQGGNTTLSRIDRCLCSLPSCDLLDRRPSSRALVDILGEGFCSDHAPVVFTFGCHCAPPDTQMPIPEWLCSHPLFVKYSTALVDEYYREEEQQQNEAAP